MPRDFPQPTADEIETLIHAQLHLEGPLLPIFHALQETYGHVPEAAIQPIADALNITRAEVHGVMSFYHDFRKVPAGRALYSSCQSVGPLEGSTCTAVTLYSGQLVAQSEKSVVITLAWVSGWWKVV